jgi:hypothetical protein
MKICSEKSLLYAWEFNKILGLCLEIVCVCKIICVVKQIEDRNSKMWDDTWIGRPREVVEAECRIQFL